jgi:hypothetical protein
MVIGKRFPDIEAKTLAGNRTQLPDAAKGRVALIGIGFVRESQYMIESWIEAYEEACKGGTVYEVPMIEGLFWRVFSFVLDEGMRAGTPKAMQDNVITYYGDASDFKQELGIEDDSIGYIFLIDKDGIVRFKGSGYATEEGLKGLFNVLGQHCKT